MKTKRSFYTEAAYIVGIIVLAFGTALMERANFGMSMVVAPAYIVYLKVAEFLPWFTFGMAEYCFQGFLLIVISITLGRFKKKYLFSFVTAFIYGNILDLCIRLVAFVPEGGMVQRVIFFAVGMVICSLGVSFLFHTYITPEAYELYVKEIAEKTGRDINRVKTVYDCVSCLVALIMSFVFFGLFVFKGVNVGTVISALLNGFLIGRCSALLERVFEFKDALSLGERFS